MSVLLDQIRQLVLDDRIHVSQHAFKRLVTHSIASDDLLASIASAIVIEEYPTYHVGPAVLLLQRDAGGLPLHAVWGIENGTTGPVVLVTAYRPDPVRWTADFRTRKP